MHKCRLTTLETLQQESLLFGDNWGKFVVFRDKKSQSLLFVLIVWRTKVAVLNDNHKSPEIVQPSSTRNAWPESWSAPVVSLHTLGPPIMPGKTVTADTIFPTWPRAYRAAVPGGEVRYIRYRYNPTHCSTKIRNIFWYSRIIKSHVFWSNSAGPPMLSLTW